MTPASVNLSKFGNKSRHVAQSQVNSLQQSHSFKPSPVSKFNKRSALGSNVTI